MKKLFKAKAIVFILLFLAQLSFSQEKKKEIYFLADTINISKENRILEIEAEGAYKYYGFFCKCIPSYDRDATFNYLLRKGNPILEKKPVVPLTSWKSLSDIIYKAGSKFDEQYSLTIIEVLPDNKYTANPVKLYIRRPIVDYIKLK